MSRGSEASEQTGNPRQTGPTGQTARHLIPFVGARATAIALLAHEVATVIERADMLSQLTDMASTDALTGLPNRRAWETSLEQALAEDQRVALAMLDLDHFKSIKLWPPNRTEPFSRAFSGLRGHGETATAAFEAADHPSLTPAA
jgi:hypothetical protein